jgi:hypothetical protein
VRKTSLTYFIGDDDMGKKTWSDEDIKYLLDNYGKLQLNEIAEHIGKTCDAVDAKLRRLGVPRIGLGERMRQLASEGKHPMQRPDVVKDFIGDKNPSCRPEVREKISQIRKAEYEAGTNKCGWTGPQRVPTEAEQAVMGGLTRLGFKWNKAISTGLSSRHGYPNHYILDFSHQDLKICIEIDGSSHRTKQARDQRKDEFLITNGWTVIRLSNDEVLSDPARIITTIRSTVDRFGDGKVAELKDRKTHS